ncbi:MAG: hypothetical protein WC505_05620 [Patescibacteria group bacterium]
MKNPCDDAEMRKILAETTSDTTTNRGGAGGYITSLYAAPPFDEYPGWTPPKPEDLRYTPMTTASTFPNVLIEALVQDLLARVQKLEAEVAALKTAKTRRSPRK